MPQVCLGKLYIDSIPPALLEYAKNISSHDITILYFRMLNPRVSKLNLCLHYWKLYGLGRNYSSLHRQDRLFRGQGVSCIQAFAHFISPYEFLRVIY